MLTDAILGNEDDRLELSRRIEYLEGENDEIRGDYDRIHQENDAMRSVEDHQFADVYFTLRQQLGIDSPLCNAAVVDTVQRLMDDLSAARDALSDLADLKVHKAKNGSDERYRVLKPKVWARAFRALGRGKEIELGALREKTVVQSSPDALKWCNEMWYKTVLKVMEKHKAIRGEVDKMLVAMEEESGLDPDSWIMWLKSVLNRIRDLADNDVIPTGKDAAIMTQAPVEEAAK